MALVSCCFVLFFALSLAASPAVLAGDADDSGAAPAPGGVEITGYHIQTNGVVPSKITKGMGIGLSLTIVDRRSEALDVYNADKSNMKVNAKLNTASFKLMSQNAIHYSQQVSPVANGIKYEIYFELVYTGAGDSFQCDLYYTDAGGAPLSVPYYPLSLTLNQCQPPAEAEGGAEIKGTGFVLKSASYGDKVEAGKNFTLCAEALATNGDANVENVTVGVTPPEEISLADGSSLVYVGTVAPGQAIPVNFAMLPAANIEEGSYTIAIDIKGINARDGSEVTSTINFTVPVEQPERFEIFETQLPGYLMAGMDDGAGYGSVTLVNQGKGTVSNVSVEIVGEGLSTEEGKQYIGHIAGGEQKTADFLLMALEPGQVKAKVVVSYESTRGEQKTLEQEFAVTVEDGGGMLDPTMPIEPPEEQMGGGFPAWGWALIVVAVIAAGVAVLVVVLRRRKAKRAALEQADLEDDLDENFDEGFGDDADNGDDGDGL